MNRGNQILAGILALQIVVLAAVFWPRGAASNELETQLFPGLTAEEIVSLRVVGPAGERVELAKQEGAWVLPAAGGYPCDGEKVSAVVDKIVDLQAARLIAQTRTSHARLGVAEDAPERLVEFALQDGTRHRLFVGTSPSFGVSHVRANSQAEVYLASGLAALDLGTTAGAWVDRLFFEVPRDEVVALTLENENGRFAFEREGETWRMGDLAPDETLDEASVQTLLNRATSVTMVEPLGTEATSPAGLRQTLAVITLRTRGADGTDRTLILKLGTKDPESGKHLLTSSESPFVVWLSGFTAEQFADKTRDDFLVLPPTPTPESTSDG
jgi:hypothetical protein